MAPRTKTELGDSTRVMSTNSSSTLCKRSVERLYCPNDPQLLRFFVKKFQRRTPLVNRGYYVRMKVIDTVVRSFLQGPSQKPKAVVNLGCGTDVLPWVSISRYPEWCNSVTFIDVDFPDLMLQKRQVVTSNDALMTPLGNVDILANDSPVLLRSDRYCQVGCDLRLLQTLEEALGSIFPGLAVEFLFVAEVSTTYMETVDADNLLKWTRSLGHAQFCLLDKMLPEGPSHPFAKTMIDHFEKVKTPLKSISRYPTKESQETRFLGAGWASVRAWSLWEAWSDEFFFSAAERSRLDEVEAFDEWEEFQMFTAHYCLLWADNVSPSRTVTVDDSTVVDRTEDVLGHRFLVNILGAAQTGRQTSYDIYSEGCQPSLLGHLPSGPGHRTNFTLTDIGDSGYLLAGGRLSPSAPLQDSWIFERGMNVWSRVHDLPRPLYRSSVVRLGNSSLALLAGGKFSESKIFDGFLLYNPQRGWCSCTITGTLRPAAVFGAILAWSGTLNTASTTTFHGVVAGGIDSGGTIASDILSWELDITDIEHPKITFEPCSVVLRGSQDREVGRRLLSRFGASCVQAGQSLFVFGGIIANSILGQASEVLVCRLSHSKCEVISCLYDPRTFEGRLVPRPLLIGAAVHLTEDGRFIVIGGGTTSFSFGPFWTKGVYSFAYPSQLAGALDATISGPQTLTIARPEPRDPTWQYLESIEAGPLRSFPGLQRVSTKDRDPNPEPFPVHRMRLDSVDHFDNILADGKPVILEGLDLGPCLVKWDANYLIEKVGPSREVVVHESTTPTMDFLAKNFRYTTKNFDHFMREIQGGARLYLRALSAREPAHKPACLEEDFPSLASDFVLPPHLARVSDPVHKFASVLRISGGVSIWLHYDVMANIYCQIKGSKRLILFPPSDVDRLSFATGSSSSSIDIFASDGRSLPPLTHPWEANLSPGDVLLIPRLWPHAAAPPTTPTSVAVNVFFKDLQSGYSHGRDVYGNRDLAAFEKGRQDIAKVLSNFQKLPGDARDFYLRRLAEELIQGAAGLATD